MNQMKKVKQQMMEISFVVYFLMKQLKILPAMLPGRHNTITYQD